MILIEPLSRRVGKHQVLMETLKVQKKILYVILVAFILSACSSDNEDISNGPERPEDPLAASLEEKLDNNTMGYAYLVMRDGSVVASNGAGQARNAIDGDRPMLVTTPMHVASLSKFITTVTALHLLEEYQISPETSISTYFPSDWELGPGVTNLTFMDFLAQQAGLNEYGTFFFRANHYDSLRRLISNGAENPQVKFYNNNHHSFMRVALPVLVDQQMGVERTYDAFNTASSYNQIVKEEIFDPIGAIATLNSADLEVALGYGGSLDANSGLGDAVDFSLVSGAYGWHISAEDFTTLWQKVWHTEEIFSSSMREEMQENRAGLFDSFQGLNGTYYIKNGWWFYSNDPAKEIQTVAVHFPDNTDVVVFINSVLGGQYVGITRLAIDAYEESLLAN